MRTDATCRRSAGFTLIELLIVISILGLLAVVLLPNIIGTKETANRAATEASMLQLQTGINAFNNAHGYFPPDDLRHPEGAEKQKWKLDNGINTGIESLVVFLSLERRSGADLASIAVSNTDRDDNGVEQPVLHTKARVEVADAWNVPLAYFGKLGMDKTQQILPGPDEDQQVAKAKRREDGSYHGAGKFQMLSAGQDGTFGTDDDIVWPPN